MERVDIDQLSRLLEGKALDTIDGEGWDLKSSPRLKAGAPLARLGVR